MSWVKAGESAIGKQRFEEYMKLRALLDFECSTLPMAIMAVGLANYSDEALDALRDDAEDLVARADELRIFICDLAERWRHQRIEAEKGPWPIP